jgi:MOSC domain-containing protein YiiM
LDGTVVSIFIAKAPHAPMISLNAAHLVPGRGVEGDRFYGLHDLQCTSGEVTYEVTLVEQEALEALWSNQPPANPAMSARRNIVVRGCSLRDLTGHTFRIGSVTLRGIARHDSCFSQDTNQADACESLYGTDLGAQILTEGVIAIGDQVQIISEPQ